MADRDAATTAPAMLLCGTVVDSPFPFKGIRIRPKHVVCIAADGRISDVLSADDDKAKTLMRDVELGKLSSTAVHQLSDSQFITPGFIDCHIHAPQYQFTGTGTDLPLMTWLNTYTFPAERRLKDGGIAAEVSTRVVRKTLSCGTTTAVYFGTVDANACKTLAHVAESIGQRALVGKVCMTRNSPEDYSESEEAAITETEEFIRYVREGAFSIVQPIITPRFIPTCSIDVLKRLAELAVKYDCHIQSHISETVDEVQFVLDLHPDKECDTQIYDECGLLRPKTIMAHGVYLSQQDINTLVKRGTSIAHCPLSNILLSQGLFDAWDAYETAGLRVGLGTDVAGGYSPSMLDAQRHMVLNSQAVTISKRSDGNRLSATERKCWAPPIHFEHAFHMATIGGARALHMEDTLGTVDAGKMADLLVLGLSDNIDTFDMCVDADTTKRTFEKVCNLGDDRNVHAVIVNGKLRLGRL